WLVRRRAGAPRKCLLPSHERRQAPVVGAEHDHRDEGQCAGCVGCNDADDCGVEYRTGGRSPRPGNAASVDAPPAEAMRRAWHPPRTLNDRGVLSPTRFAINPSYERDGERRWLKYSDVLV